MRVPYPVDVESAKDRFQEFALALAPSAAAVANYCDHVEHNESAQTRWVTEAADALQQHALRLAHEAEIDLIDAYGERLGAIERRNPLSHPQSFDGRGAALAAGTWRDLQVVQVEHDRQYHPDVTGLAKIEQLRHYTLHLIKIVGAFAEPAEEEELLTRRLPDTLLFALKLRTVMGNRLDKEPLPRRNAVRSLATRADSVGVSA
jgi:hypothetical protein